MSEAPTWQVALSDTTIGEEEVAAAAEVVRSGWLTQGARVAAFEADFAAALGARHAIAVANCTLGLELAYAAAGVGPGDEVIVPALTFVATANAARRLGAVPVFADVRSEDDLCIDPVDVARRITPRTRAICPVHYAGFAADLTALGGIAREARVALIEDCAHAPLARSDDDGRTCGTVGDVAAFSFFGNKNLTTGEGGMLTTMRDDVASRLRLLRSHGMSTGTWDRARGHAFSYDVTEVGTNARMDEVRAAIGRVQLGRLAAGNRAREAHVAHYRARLADLPGLVIPFSRRDMARAAHHLFVVLLPVGVDRTAVMTAMRARGIQTSIHYPPTHRFRAYETANVTLPVTDRIAGRLLTLPLWPTMRAQQVDLVVDALRDALADHRQP